MRPCLVVKGTDVEDLIFFMFLCLQGFHSCSAERSCPGELGKCILITHEGHGFGDTWRLPDSQR